MATPPWKVGLEVSTQDGSIRGRAVFGTWRGLEACGNGFLAGVRDAPALFEFGRSRDDPLHHVIPKHEPVFFCRRAREERHGSEIELVGALGPIKDAQERYGFLGSCVAVHVDRRHPTHFGDWAGAVQEICSLFAKAKESFPTVKQHSFLRNCPVPPTEEDKRFDWVPTTDVTTDVLSLHWSSESEGTCDAKVVQYMQAIAFKYGTLHPTILVFKNAVWRSQPLQSAQREEYLHELHRLRDQKSRQYGSNSADVPSSVASVVHAGPEVVLGRLIQLEERVQRLEERVSFEPSRPMVPVTAEQQGTASVEGQEFFGSFPEKCQLLAALAAVIGALVAGVVLWVMWS